MWWLGLEESVQYMAVACPDLCGFCNPWPGPSLISSHRLWCCVHQSIYTDVEKIVWSHSKNIQQHGYHIWFWEFRWLYSVVLSYSFWMCIWLVQGATAAEAKACHIKLLSMGFMFLQHSSRQFNEADIVNISGGLCLACYKGYKNRDTHEKQSWPLCLLIWLHRMFTLAIYVMYMYVVTTVSSPQTYWLHYDVLIPFLCNFWALNWSFFLLTWLNAGYIIYIFFTCFFIIICLWF